MKRNFIFILFVWIVTVTYAQKDEVRTTTALWKTPTVADFKDVRANDINYVEVALNQCCRDI